MDNTRDPTQVLVVDDEVDIREGSERILKRMGCQVFKASCGKDALAAIDDQPVAIVLLDLKMPGMDGMEALFRILEKDRSILVIIITGYATVETAIEAMKRGAYDFIPKPFEPDQLRIVVSRAQEKLRLTQEAAQLEAQRQRTLADLHTEKSRIRTIVELLPNGIVVTNAQGNVVLMNPAFRAELSVDPVLVPGQPVCAYVTDEGLCSHILACSEGKYEKDQDAFSYEFSISDEKFFLARARSFRSRDGTCLGAVVVLSDITTMKVLDRLKSEFVATVSHELRSPLSTIHEQLAVVLRDMSREEELERDQHILNRAKEKTQGLISLIGDLLDLSRIESGSICQEPKPVVLEDLLKNITDFLGIRAQAKQQQLIFEMKSTGLPPLTADPLALESIFGNLISNAITYTPEGGKIQVMTDTHDDRIRVRVSDTGFGIESRHLEKIFDRFYRVKDENTRFITGTGLGLAIVKRLVASLGGAIEVESTPGKGSVFTVTLPIRP